MTDPKPYAMRELLERKTQTRCLRIYVSVLGKQITLQSYDRMRDKSYGSTRQLTPPEARKLGTWLLHAAKISRGLTTDLKKSLSISNASEGGYPTGSAHHPKSSAKKAKEVHSRWSIYAKMLRAAILKVRNMTKLNIKFWAYSFEKLHRLDGVPVKRVRRVLKWYCNRVTRTGDLIRSNPDFLPIAYNAEKFRGKFAQIEGAKARLDQEHGLEDQDAPKIKKAVRRMSNKELKQWEKDFS